MSATLSTIRWNLPMNPGTARGYDGFCLAAVVLERCRLDWFIKLAVGLMQVRVPRSRLGVGVVGDHGQGIGEERVDWQWSLALAGASPREVRRHLDVPLGAGRAHPRYGLTGWNCPLDTSVSKPDGSAGP